MVRTTFMLVLLLCGCTQTSDFDQVERTNHSQPKAIEDAEAIEDAVSIVFSESSYSFRIATAARGIEINYEIVVGDDVKGVLPLSQQSNSNFELDLSAPDQEQAGVLLPFARLRGDGQFYGEFTGGCLAAPTTISPSTLKRGRYAQTFKWDGRNLPNDGGGGRLPYGESFPPGKYTLEVSCIGKVVRQGVQHDFRIANSVVVTLTD